MDCIKCKGCKNCEESLDDAVECYGEYNDCKKLSDYFRKCDKIYEHFKCFLGYVKEAKKYFVL